MCVRSISVGCVSNVAAIAATVPDEKLIAVCGAPCCTSTGMFRKLPGEKICLDVDQEIWDGSRITNVTAEIVSVAHLLQALLQRCVEEIVESGVRGICDHSGTQAPEEASRPLPPCYPDDHAHHALHAQPAAHAWQASKEPVKHCRRVFASWPQATEVTTSLPVLLC